MASGWRQWMSNNDLITIAIPLYNHEIFIESCLDGVLAQNLTNVELLLIDDGSSDDGFLIAKAWEDRHRKQFIRTWFEQQVNAGITRTMDRLIQQSMGQFILLLASDDVLLPGSVEKRLVEFQDPSVTAVFGDAIPIDDSGRAIGESAIHGLGVPASRDALLDQRTILWELIFRWNVYGSVLLCRRTALVAENGESVLETGIYSEDMQLYYRLAAQGVLRYIDEPVAQYRIHVTNTSRIPENLSKLRKNIHESRRHAAKCMPFMPRLIVRLQAFTYFRWRGGIVGFISMPLVAFAYLCILSARAIYDAYRRRILGQERVPVNQKGKGGVS
jgi:glycosyltransferase involved in cell wall biosynthesis